MGPEKTCKGVSMIVKNLTVAWLCSCFLYRSVLYLKVRRTRTYNQRPPMIDQNVLLRVLFAGGTTGGSKWFTIGAYGFEDSQRKGLRPQYCLGTPSVERTCFEILHVILPSSCNLTGYRHRQTYTAVHFSRLGIGIWFSEKSQRPIN